MLLVIFVLNLVISVWNAYAVGAMWTETKLIGGWARVMSWSGAIMAASGLTWCYLVVYGFLGLASGYLKQGDFELLLAMGYLLIVLPVVGSGFAIWADSVVQAYRQRSFGSVAVAGWNAAAQFHNTWNAARQAPSVFSSVFDALSSKGSKSSKDSAGSLILFVLLLLALLAGVMTTWAIIRWSDRRVALEIIPPSNRVFSRQR